jgi:hypothetical protein
VEDISIQPLGMNIIAPENGEGDFLQLVVVKGIPLPFADPNTGEPVMAPTGQYRIPLDRDFAIQLANKLIEEAEKLPEKHKTDLQVATNLNGVDKLAEFERRIR